MYVPPGSLRVRPTALLATTVAALLLACRAARVQEDPCLFNGDCTGNLVCASGICRVRCAGPRDCPTGQTCSTVGGQAVCLSATLCRLNSECGAGTVCSVNGTCVPAC